MVETADPSNIDDEAGVEYFDGDYKRRWFDNWEFRGSHENCKGVLCISG